MTEYKYTGQLRANWTEYSVTEAPHVAWYYNSSTGETSLSRPFKDLPDGWFRYSTFGARVWYYNVHTDESSWDFPEFPKPARAPPVAKPKRASSRELRKKRLLEEPNERTLFHATSMKNARAIIEDQFYPGTSGWLGPGVYFSVNPVEARRQCQYKGQERVVVLECRVKLGRTRVLQKRYDGLDDDIMLDNRFDSASLEGRDIVMIHQDDDGTRVSHKSISLH